MTPGVCEGLVRVRGSQPEPQPQPYPYPYPYPNPNPTRDPEPGPDQVREGMIIGARSHCLAISANIVAAYLPANPEEIYKHLLLLLEDGETVEPIPCRCALSCTAPHWPAHSHSRTLAHSLTRSLAHLLTCSRSHVVT